MADMSQYTQLTIPQGSVTQITDSNNNIIWKAGACAYRQLEYIHLSGAEHLETGFGQKQGYPKEFTFSFEQSSGDNFIIGCYDSSLSANNRRRYYLRHNSTNNLSFVLGNTWQTSVTCNVNQKYVARMNVYQDGNYKMEWQLYDEWGNQWDSNIVDSGSTSAPTTKLATIGANNSNSIEYPFVGNIYLVREWAGGSSGSFNYPTTNTIFFPAQRKSDGVCGLYRINNNTFYPLIGTNITSAAAGPTVCENPLWERSIYTNAGNSGNWTSSGHTRPWTNDENLITEVPGGSKVLIKATANITTSGASDCYGKISVMGSDVRSISGTSNTTANYTINQTITLPTSGNQSIFSANTGHTGYNSSGAYSSIEITFSGNRIKLLGGCNTTSTQTTSGTSRMSDISITVL